MKPIIKVLISVVFLTAIVVLSARYFISQKISNQSLEDNIQTIISNHFAGTNVKFKGVEFRVGSELLLKAESISILENATSKQLLSANDISMRIPIMVAMGGKGTIKTTVDQLTYNYTGKLHLLDFISAQKAVRGAESVPNFFIKARHDFKIKNLNVDQHDIGRVSFRNLNLKKTSAFEIKSKLGGSNRFSAEIRVIGEISLKELLFTGEVITQSTVSIENLSLPTSSLENKKMSLKGNIETRGKLGSLEGKIKLASEDVMALASEFEVLPKTILLKNITGTLDNAHIISFLPTFEIGFEGTAGIERSSFKVDPDITFKSYKPSKSDLFITELKGELTANKLSFDVQSSGLNGSIKTSAVAAGNLGNILSSGPIYEDYSVELDLKALDLNQLSFAEFFASERLALKNLPKLKLTMSFSDLALREQVFRGSFKLNSNNDSVTIKNIILADEAGRISGDLDYQITTKKLRFKTKLVKFEVDFIKAIMGNKDIHLSGKFDGVFETRDETESYLLDIKGSDGNIKGLAEFLSLKKIYELTPDSPEKKIFEFKNLEEFTSLKLKLALTSKNLSIGEIVMTTPSRFNLKVDGNVQLERGPSEIIGSLSRNGNQLMFSMSGNGVFLSPKQEQIQIIKEGENRE